MSRTAFSLTLSAICFSIAALFILANPVRAETEDRDAIIRDIFVNLEIERFVLEGRKAAFSSKMGSMDQYQSYRGIIAAYFQRVAGIPAIEAEFRTTLISQFSEQELIEIRDLLRRPFGRKLLSVLPDLQAKANDLAYERSVKHIAELKGAIAEEQKAFEPSMPIGK